jgi:sigma-B regulation protein RsbU (phosphoserine phosphatase)
MLDFHLFSFVPVLLLSGILWIERILRKGPKKKNRFLFLSILAIFLAGLVQMLGKEFILGNPNTDLNYLNFPIYAVVIVLYFLGFFLLEYSIHCKRIDQSFLTTDFRKSLSGFKIWSLAAAAFILIILWSWIENFLIYESSQIRGVSDSIFGTFLGSQDKEVNEAMNLVFPVLTIFFHVFLFIIIWRAARTAFDLQEGVIRQRSYTFYTLLLVSFFFTFYFSPFSFTTWEPIPVPENIPAMQNLVGNTESQGIQLEQLREELALAQSQGIDTEELASEAAKLERDIEVKKREFVDKLGVASDPYFFMNIIWIFLILNIVYTIRVVEEFFFWAMYHLRSDRAKVEQRQHALSLLIRRVINSTEDEDTGIVRDTMENALTKAKSRTVVEEYNVTGMVVYRRNGDTLKVDGNEMIWGYSIPLVTTKNFKNLDKNKLNDLIIRGTYDLDDIESSSPDSIKDYGANIIKRAMTEKEPIFIEDVPDNFKGMQRMIGVFPVFDTAKFAGMVIIFKDSFHKIYPFEKEVFSDLCENLGTIFALIAGKEVQKERNRLQGEMETAKNIQTSILPANPQLEGYTIAASMETATEVGGDVYDLVPNPYGNYFGIGDVAGHGLSAGIMALINMAAFHGALETSKTMNLEIPVDTLYDIVNRVLCVVNRDRIGSDKFMTQNYFVEKDGVIKHAGTHEIALIFRAATGEVEELPQLTDKTGFLGLSEYVDSRQSLGDFKLNSGDYLFLYTDGVIEAKAAKEQQFGLERVKDIIKEHPEAQPGEIIVYIKDFLRDWAKAGDFKKHGGNFADDITMVILKKD